MGLSKNRATPKWMVKIMENPIKMDDLGGKPTIFGNIRLIGKYDRSNGFSHILAPSPPNVSISAFCVFNDMFPIRQKICQK